MHVFRTLKISAILFLLTVNYAHAQLCTGSLGDPIVKFTFGYDTLGFGLTPSPLPAGVTNYPFVGNTCPLDGFYTISDYTANCFGNTWYSLPEDHTPGDTYGYMMLINASNTPGDFYTQTVTGLCSGTTYEFAAWIANLNVPTACGGTPTKPNVTFNIETLSGTVLKTYNTGDISVAPFATWRQFGTFFTTPSTVTDVVIRMTNNAPGGCGNDIALDDITFRACGAVVSASINGSATSLNVCAGGVASNTFSANVSAGGPTTSYQWQISTDNGLTWTDIPGATGTSYVPTVTTGGNYKYRFTVAEAPGTPPSCRTLSNILNFTVDLSPVKPLFTSADTVCISSQPVVFTDQPQSPAGSVTQWIWDFGDGSTPVTASTNAAQSHTYAAAGSYTVTLQVKNATGCASVAFTKNVVVVATPTVDFSYTNSCENSPVNFAAITNAGSTATYVWSFGDATTSTQANPVKTYATGTSFNVTLQIVAYGCTGSVTKPVTLTAKPATPSFTYPVTGCVNQSVTFTPSAAAANVNSWAWNFGDGSAPVNATTNAAQTHTYTTTGSFTVSLQTGASGCLSSVYQQTITISAAPTADFNYVSSCAGSAITFASTVTPSAGAQYLWAFGDATSSTTASPVKSYSAGGTYTVVLTATVAGCSTSVTHPVVVVPVLFTPVVSVDSVSGNFLRFRWQAIPGATAYKVSTNAGTSFTDPSSGPTGLTHSIANLTAGQTVNLIVKALGTLACEENMANVSGTTNTSAATTEVFIPNTFTPNGDGRNDLLKIYGNVKQVNMKIFNQWGQLIHMISSPTDGWDGRYKGKLQPVGVYMYAANIILNDGKVIVKKGSINLLK